MKQLLDYIMEAITPQEMKDFLINKMNNGEFPEDLITHIYYEIWNELDSKLEEFSIAKNLDIKQAKSIKAIFGQNRKYPLLYEVLFNENGFGLTSIDTILKPASLLPIKNLLGSNFFNQLADCKTKVKANVGPCELLFATVFTDVQLNDQPTGDLLVEGIPTELKRDEFVPWGIDKNKSGEVGIDKLGFQKYLSTLLPGVKYDAFLNAHSKTKKYWGDVASAQNVEEISTNLIKNVFLNVSTADIEWGAKKISSNFSPEHISKVIAIMCLYYYKQSEGFSQLLYAGGKSQKSQNKVVLIKTEEFSSLENLWNACIQFEASPWRTDGYYKTPKLFIS